MHLQLTLEKVIGALDEVLPVVAVVEDVDLLTSWRELDVFAAAFLNMM